MAKGGIRAGQIGWVWYYGMFLCLPHCLNLVGGLVAIFYFPIYWVANHPNWLSYFSEVFKPPTSNNGCLLFPISKNWLAASGSYLVSKMRSASLASLVCDSAGPFPKHLRNARCSFVVCDQRVSKPFLDSLFRWLLVVVLHEHCSRDELV